jgi:hypothetical protein
MGESVPARVLMAGSVVLVIGVSTPVTVDTSGVTVPVTGASTPVVTVDMTGDAVLVMSPSELVTGASAPPVAVVTEDAVPATGESVWGMVLRPGATVAVMGATAPVATETAGATVPVAAETAGATAPVEVETAGAAVPAAEPGDVVMVEVAVEGAADPAAVAAETVGVAAEAELTVSDPELVEPLPGAEATEPVASAGGLEAAWVPEVACEVVEVTGDVAELTAEVTGDVAELTAEVTGDVTELTGEVTAERGDAVGLSEVAACACRENTSMITKIPAATIASCTARRAMRRRIGCGMTSSHSPETGPGTHSRYRGSVTRAQLSWSQTGHAVRPPPYSAVAGRRKVNRTANRIAHGTFAGRRPP